MGCVFGVHVGTYDCRGGDVITVSGAYFGSNMTVLIDGEPCVNVTQDDDILNSDTLTCMFIT